jgi:small subunit ribosomal protein S6
MVIFDATTEPPAIQAVVDRVLDTVRSTGGNPGAIDRWGRRTFAYEVNHKREGYYLLLEFTSEVQTVADVDRLLSLADEVIRHKVVRLPEGGTGQPRRRPPNSESPAPSRGGGRPGPTRVDAASAAE